MPAFYQDQFPAEYAVHQKYATAPLLMELVWTQGCILADITGQLLQNRVFDTSTIDTHLLAQACLLHDIGVYRTGGFEWINGEQTSDKPYIQHSIVGAWILMKENYPIEVVQAALTHKGAGINETDIAKLGLDLPTANYEPSTVFLQLISYASKYHSKAPKWRTAEEIVKSLERYGSDKAEIFAQWYEFFGTVDLKPLMDKYEEWHAAIGAQVAQLQAGKPNTLII